jgi:2-polyprenyl-6-methoxyphenol hydroxylase-like FAD-dependent oxidoreductase
VQTDWHGFFREAAGPGWALVGDAGHFKDFTPGQGISDALRQADRLAAAIAEGLSSDRESTLDDRLQNWWRWRDEDAWEMYWFASDMGVPGPPTPLVTRVLRDLSERPGGGQDLLRMLDHEISPSALFTRRRLLAAAGRALADRPREAVATAREIGASVREQVRRDRLRPGVAPAR